MREDNECEEGETVDTCMEHGTTSFLSHSHLFILGALALDVLGRLVDDQVYSVALEMHRSYKIGLLADPSRVNNPTQVFAFKNNENKQEERIRRRARAI